MTTVFFNLTEVLKQYYWRIALYDQFVIQGLIESYTVDIVTESTEYSRDGTEVTLGLECTTTPDFELPDRTITFKPY